MRLCRQKTIDSTVQFSNQLSYGTLFGRLERKHAVYADQVLTWQF